jgi:hypothetical protein
MGKHHPPLSALVVFFLIEQRLGGGEAAKNAASGQVCYCDVEVQGVDPL